MCLPLYMIYCLFLTAFKIFSLLWTSGTFWICGIERFYFGHDYFGLYVLQLSVHLFLFLYSIWEIFYENFIIISVSRFLFVFCFIVICAIFWFLTFTVILGLVFFTSSISYWIPFMFSFLRWLWVVGLWSYCLLVLLSCFCFLFFCIRARTQDSALIRQVLMSMSYISSIF